MKVEILGWSSTGLRSVDLNFDFVSKVGSVYKTTLIQMPNGTGKTTTLNCIRAALTGEARGWTPATVSQYRGNKGRGEFVLKLRVDDQRLTISMSFDFTVEKVMYKTTSGRSQVPGYQPPADLSRFLSEHFVRLLVFDGELPGELLDPDKTKAEDAIDAFFLLYLLSNVSEASERFYLEATRGAKASSEATFKKREKQLKESKSQCNKIVKAKKTAIEKLEACRREISVFDAKINEHTGNEEELTKQMEKVDTELKEMRGEQAGLLNHIVEETQQPQKLDPMFGNMLSDLYTNLDRLKLPESTSKRFFEELSEEPSCICGRILGDAERLFIREKAADYLGSDTSGALNHIKTQTKKYVLDGGKEFDFPADVEKLKEIGHRIGIRETKKAAIKEKIIESGGVEVQEFKKKCDILKSEAEQLAATLDEINREPNGLDDGESICLKYWITERKQRDKQLSEITDTVKIRRAKDIVQNILFDAKRISRKKMSLSIVNQMNDRLSVMLKGHNIQVSNVDKSVKLLNKHGASLGQTLAVGYAFLTTLFDRAGHEFPFVVDAPVTALDGRVRNEVASVLPLVCNQFVAFVLDTEREHFAKKLDSVSEGNIQYITAFEDSFKNDNLKECLPKSGVEKSSNGIVVSGKEYFYSVTFPSKDQGV